MRFEGVYSGGGGWGGGGLQSELLQYFSVLFCNKTHRSHAFVIATFLESRQIEDSVNQHDRQFVVI